MCVLCGDLCALQIVAPCVLSACTHATIGEAGLGVQGVGVSIIRVMQACEQWRQPGADVSTGGCFKMQVHRMDS
jgi:hypothetical protein